MAVSVKGKNGEAKPLSKSSVSSLLKGVKDKLGDGVSLLASEAENVVVERIPTGLLDVDIATGGGFPRGKISIVYGPESSGKTNLILKTIANHQRLWPDEECVFVDLENAFDPAWAKKMGVNLNKLHIIQPDFAEQAVDIADMLMEADNIGLIIFDSIAALVTHAETEKSAEGAIVGGASLVVGKLARKIVLGQMKAKKQGRFPTFIAVNQIRLKIGVMHGDPETMPGGKPLMFASSMTIRLYGKNEVVKEVNPVLPAMKVTTCIIRKWKVPILQTNFEYKMVVIPHKGLAVGECDDWNPLTHKLKGLGLLDKVGTKFQFYGEEFPTIKQIKEHVMGTPGLLDKVRADVCRRLLEGATMVDAQEGDD
jgi:recombination protein RecA